MVVADVAGHGFVSEGAAHTPSQDLGGHAEPAFVGVVCRGRVHGV